MDDDSTPMAPEEAEQRFAAMLEEAGLPRFDSTFHDPEIHELQLRWEHGLSIHLDLRRDDWEPIDDEERASILGRRYGDLEDEPIHVYVPGGATDPRDDSDLPGVTVHRGPALHPDDLMVFDGIPMTSPSRTLIDCAELSTIDELRGMFARAQELGLLDPDAMWAARARVEWRPSLAMLDQVIEEFCG